MLLEMGHIRRQLAVDAYKIDIRANYLRHIRGSAWVLPSAAMYFSPFACIVLTSAMKLLVGKCHLPVPVIVMRQLE